MPKTFLLNIYLKHGVLQKWMVHIILLIIKQIYQHYDKKNLIQWLILTSHGYIIVS